MPEPPRLSRRLILLGGSSDDKDRTLLPRDTRAGSSSGAGALERIRLAVGGYRIGGREDWMHIGDAPTLGSTG